MTATPTPVEAFCAEIRPLGFGRKSTVEPEQFLGIAENVIQAIRHGTTPSDAGAILFRSNARPTWEQCTAFVQAAIRHLAPELEYTPDAFVHEQPIRRAESMRRTAMYAMHGRRS